MKRLLIFLIAGLVSMGVLSANTEVIHFATVIPEDFGVVYPDNALRMDHLLFRIGDVLVDEEGIAEAVFDWIHNFIVVDVIYYGNLSEDYEVTLTSDSNSGWISKNDSSDYIPINVYFNEFRGEDGIRSITGDSPESVDITVPAYGPRRGQKVAEMVIAWEPGLSLEPGYYDMDLNLSLWSR